jgi:hypothetical protein
MRRLADRTGQPVVFVRGRPVKQAWNEQADRSPIRSRCYSCVGRRRDPDLRCFALAAWALKPACLAGAREPSSCVILAAWPLAKPLRVGPGLIGAGFHTPGQGLGEHERGGGLECAVEQAGGAGCLEAQGPPVLAAGADLGEFDLALRLPARFRSGFPDPDKDPMTALASVIAACERSRSPRARSTDPSCNSAIATPTGWPRDRKKLTPHPISGPASFGLPRAASDCPTASGTTPPAFPVPCSRTRSAASSDSIRWSSIRSSSPAMSER